MKISFNWLKQYLDVAHEPALIAQYLTDIGLEVEHIEKWEKVNGSLAGVVTGAVLTKEKHPEADRLSITTVDIGKGEPLQIVCGAANVAAGQKVLVATVGTTLYPSAGEPLTIKKSKIRGAASEGMICALDELGLGSDHSGIFVLDSSTGVGQEAKAVLELAEDWIFEIGLTPNRADAASHLGVARDLAAVLQVQTNQNVEIKLPYAPFWKITPTATPIAVTVQDQLACARYSGIKISNVTVKPSPEWLQNRLKAIGLKPINNLVDVGNFVMHELGQPLHLFDADQLAGQQLIVKKVTEQDLQGGNTSFTTLDGIERKVAAGDLIIADAKGPVCFAGVFGGLHSGVSEQTTAVFIESAYFNPGDVRKTSKRIGIKTDASFRFERGTDPHLTLAALQRATELLKDVAGGQVDGALIDIYPQAVEPLKIGFSFKNCNQLCGVEIPTKTVKQILIALGIEILSESADALLLSVPPFKVDVKREVDVIEEVLRIYGYNAVPLPSAVKSTLGIAEGLSPELTQQKIADTLVGQGFNEILTNSLTKLSYYAPPAFDPALSVQVVNPLSTDLNCLRQTLLFSGLEALSYNINRKNQDLRFFEFGKTYQKTGEGTFKEQLELQLLISGRIEAEQWNSKYGHSDFYTLKGLVQFVLERFGLNEWSEETFESQIATETLQGRIGKVVVFKMGKVNKTLLKQFDIKQDVYFAELPWTALFNFVKNRQTKYKALPEFQAVKRDLALILDKQVQFKEVEHVASQTERKLLKQVQLVDVYEGEKIANDKKSYAIRFTLQDDQETLTSGKIDKLMERLLKQFQEKLGAALRS